MHTVEIPQFVVDRAAARRGDRHLFGDLEPRRTALVVVDMQNAFVRADYGQAHAAEAVMVSDANAARGDQQHNAALANVYTSFGDVMATDELLSLLRDRRP